MAVSEVSLPTGQWTKIIDNKSAGSFQNIGQWSIMIAYTSTDTAPADTAKGFVYTTNQKETKATFADKTYEAAPMYVWARPVSRSSKVLVES